MNNKKKEKILIVVYCDDIGGAEGVLKMAAEELQEQGKEIHVYFLSKIKTYKWQESNGLTLNYSSFNSQYLGALSLVFYLLKTSSRFHYAFSSQVYVNALLGFTRKIRVLKTSYLIGRESTSIFTRYKGFRLSIYKIFYNIGYTALDLLICQTDEMKENFIKNLPKIASKIHVKTIVNPFRQPSSKRVNDLSEKENIESVAPYIVTAGRFIPEKGYDILIQSFAEIHLKNPFLKLVILGNGLEKENLENLILELNLSDVVFLPGYAENVYPWFANAECCVISSRVEGFPNVLLQMMSQNEKVVSTLCAGGIETMQGIITAEPDNVESLTNAILEVLASEIDNSKHFDNQLEKRNIANFLLQIKSSLY